jgi:hypothetical protein
MLVPLWQHPGYRHQESHLHLISKENTSNLMDAAICFPIPVSSNFVCPLTNQSLGECNCIKSALKPHDLCLFCPAARMHLPSAI